MTAVWRFQARRRPAGDPVCLVVLAHGYAERVGRYEHVAQALVARKALLIGPDHVAMGLGGRAGARRGRRAVVETCAERHGADLGGLVLSGPAVGLGPVIEGWLAAPELPSNPIDVAVLSRDPAVGEADAADQLVWHGGWKRPTLEALAAADRAVVSRSSGVVSSLSQAARTTRPGTRGCAARALRHPSGGTESERRARSRAPRPPGDRRSTTARWRTRGMKSPTRSVCSTHTTAHAS